MKYGMNKVLSMLAAFTTLASVTCSASDMQMRNLENRVNALEQRRGSNGMINPPARPVVRDGVDLWIQAEVLYMHATEDCLAYGIKNNGTTVTTGATVVDGRVKNVGYNWDWGFRAGIGYNLPHDGWDVLLNWTWFQASETRNEKPPVTESILPTQAAPLDTIISATFPSAKGKATLHMNLLDFELGREFFVSKWLTLRPFMGARAAWFNRAFKYSYRGAGKDSGHDHNRFRAGGIRGGLDTQWGLGSGWSFFGDIALSLLYGKQRLHSHQDASGVRVQHLHNAWSATRAMLDLAFGLRWDHLFGCNDAYRIRFQLGWEQTSLFGYEKDINFVNGTYAGKFAYNSGDLAVNGVSLQVRFDF